MRVTIGIATRGNDINHKLAVWLAQCTELNSMHSLTILIQPSPFSAADGQEKLFKAAYANGSDFLLLIDSDIAPPPFCLNQMLIHDKSIVTAPIWFCDTENNDIHLNISYGIERDGVGRVYVPNPLGGLERIKTGSFGLLLVRRNVLRLFVDVNESYTHWSKMLDDSYINNFSDSIFFAKCDKLGIEAYVDWELRGTGHYKLINLCDDTIYGLIARISGNVEYKKDTNGDVVLELVNQSNKGGLQ